VEIVTFCPITIRHKTDHTANFTNDIVGFSGTGERLVSAVMLNDKDANQEKSIYHSQGQYQPEGYIDQEIHGNPDGNKRQKRVKDLYGSLSGVR
jgi:hypothetical protein